MTETSLDVLVNTFCFESHLGSLQYLHFFRDESHLHTEFPRYLVNDEYDHSFVCYEKSGFAQVLWKNKAGQIQFCGSGAYALACVIGQVCQLDLFKIHSEFIKLNARYCNKGTFLEFSAKMPDSKVQVMDRIIYFNSDSGLFFLCLNNLDDIKDDVLLNSYQLYLTERYSDHIHGFCAFYWDGVLGHLRYFTPWHGRDEDYVTGSVHQNLTPLVNSLYRAKKQTWVQVSSSKGQLRSMCLDDKVIINGQCIIEKMDGLDKLLKGN